MAGASASWQRTSQRLFSTYVYFPLALAAAIGLEPGEEVEWELLDRGELHLVRAVVPSARAKARPRQAG